MVGVGQWQGQWWAECLPLCGPQLDSLVSKASDW